MYDNDPSTNDSASTRPTRAPVAMSLVIPAWNEVDRLPPYLEAIREHFTVEFGSDCEVIVVDDGSDDGMADVVERRFADWAALRVLRLDKNKGKGAAVRHGMAAARGRLRLFADADGATPILEERRLREALDRGADVAVGSRLLQAEGVACRRTWRRGLAGRLFAAVARALLGLRVRDTQCGFKMFTAEAADRLFPRCREDRFLLDLELLMFAERLGLSVEEIAIDWSDQPGSRMRLSRELWGIVRGLWRLRRRVATMKFEFDEFESRRSSPAE